MRAHVRACACMHALTFRFKRKKKMQHSVRVYFIVSTTHTFYSQNKKWVGALKIV